MTTLERFETFYIWYNLLQYRLSKKQASNFISASHAIGATFLSHYYLRDSTESYFHSLRKFSTAYFLHDTIQILLNEQLSFTNLCYLYHHLASTYLLNSNVSHNIIGQIFFWGELSNLPTYPLYYYLHAKGEHKNKIKLLRILQRLFYICIRIPIITRLISEIIKKQDKQIPLALIGTIPIYFMGIGWSYKIMTQK